MYYKSLKDCDNTIRQMLVDGVDLKNIMKRIKQEGVSTTLGALQTYIKENIDNTIQQIDIPIVEKVKTFPSKNFNFNNIRLDEHLDTSNELNIIEFLQKCHLYLVVRQLEIVASEQEMFYQGKTESQPIQSISKLRLLEEMLYKIAPYHIVANQSQAIRTVELMGYTLSFEGENVNVDYSTNS